MRYERQADGRVFDTAQVDATDLFNAMEEDDRWGGFGYLGGREGLNGNHVPVVSDVDFAVVGAAEELGWTGEMLFQWANSRPGRHFADDPPFDGLDDHASTALDGAGRALADELPEFREWAGESG